MNLRILINSVSPARQKPSRFQQTWICIRDTVKLDKYDNANSHTCVNPNYSSQAQVSSALKDEK